MLLVLLFEKNLIALKAMESDKLQKQAAKKAPSEPAAEQKPPKKPAEKPAAEQKQPEKPAEKPAEQPEKPLTKVQLAALGVFGAGLAAAFYLMPRFLKTPFLGNNPWVSYFYTYGLSLLVFAAGALWVYFTRNSRSAQKMKEEKTWLAVIFCGLCFFALLHGLWISLTFG